MHPGKNIDEQTLAFFRTVFCCTPEIASAIAGRAKERHFPEQHKIIKQGDRAEATYLLLDGRANALKYGPQGQLAFLREYLPGDFFGAIASSMPEPEEADVVAIERVRTAVFLIMDFLGLAETHACVGLALTKMLLRQLKETSTRASERSMLSANGRVCAELLRLAQLSTDHSIRPAPVLANLAVRAHTTRETVSRTVNGLERRGIIRRDDNTLFVIAIHRLEELII